MGIWKDATLEATGPARVNWARIETTLKDEYTQADVVIGLEISTTKAMAVRATVQLIGPNAPASC